MPSPWAGALLTLLALAAAASAVPFQLTQLAGTEACISETGSSGVCTDGKGLDEPVSVVVSPDGRSAYQAAEGSDRLSGGSGNDRLAGGSGRDRLSGGRGRDREKQ